MKPIKSIILILLLVVTTTILSQPYQSDFNTVKTISMNDKNDIKINKEVSGNLVLEKSLNKFDINYFINENIQEKISFIFINNVLTKEKNNLNVYINNYYNKTDNNIYTITLSIKDNKLTGVVVKKQFSDYMVVFTYE